MDGRWFRHVAVPYAATALEGRRANGRWGTAAGFGVLYLGRPVDSVVVEAYRHLIDPAEDPDDAAALAAQVQPRMLITVDVTVTDVLDLRNPATRAQIGLTLDVLRSPTEDRAAYAACQQVAQVAHQLGRHGILAPAATGLGDTLALFPDLLPPAEHPVRAGDDQLWQHLPPDPRRPSTRTLRLVRGSDAPTDRRR